jgi:hypothetical protein
MSGSKQLTTGSDIDMTAWRGQAWSLAALLAALLSGLLIATGCKPEGNGPTGESPSSIADGSAGGGNEVINTSPSDRPAGSDEVGQDIKLLEVTESTAVEFTYRNGREAGNNSILESLGGGVAIVDFDRDGWLDLFLPGGGRYQEKQVLGLTAGLYRNLGEMKFSDVSEEAGIFQQELYSHAAQVGDFDNDGFPDVLVTGYGSLQLFHNQGDGTFLEIHTEALLDSRSWSSSAGWGDFNGDSFLDLYICNYVNWSFDNHPNCPGPEPGQIEICPPKSFEGLADVLYFSNGDGTFRDVTVESGVRIEGNVSKSKGLGVLVGDIDLDGDLDIYVANDTEANFLYLNDGSGTFEEKGLLHSVAYDSIGGANGSMGVDLGDYNGDLLPDLWVANYEQESFALYENRGRGQFLHVSDKSGVTSLGGLFVGFGTAFWDLDLDGDEDLVVANGHVIKYPASKRVNQLPLLLINREGKRFVRKRFAPGDGYFGTPHSGRGLAMGDLDEDGDADLVFSNNVQQTAIVENQTDNGNHYVRVRLIGRRMNRDAVGASLILHTTDGDQLRLIKGGGSYLSQSEPRVYWGVADGVETTGLTVTWPGGSRQTIERIPLDSTTVLLEPQQ